MRIAAFAGEFVALAAWTGQSEEELRQDEDFQAADRQHWTAWEHDQVTATVHSWRGPDGRHRLYFDRCRADSYGPLAAAISGECYTQVDAADLDAVEELRSAGFAAVRLEHEYEVPVTLLDVPVPDGLQIITADRAQLQPLMLLDCAVRAGIPGSGGWQPDPAWFRAETYESPFFDPQTYRVALDRDEYVGLARIWRAEPASLDAGSIADAETTAGIRPLPRLGCVGVRRGYRRRGLARALIGAAFAPLRERRIPLVSAAVDESNEASNALFASLQATVVGGTFELHRP